MYINKTSIFCTFLTELYMNILINILTNKYANSIFFVTAFIFRYTFFLLTHMNKMILSGVAHISVYILIFRIIFSYFGKIIIHHCSVLIKKLVNLCSKDSTLFVLLYDA